MTVGAIILAAGSARRMGSDKLLADLRGKPLVAHVAERIAAAGLPPPLVVIAPGNEGVRAALGDHAASFVVAERSGEGMSQSLRAGIMAVPEDWAATFVCLGDMPLVPSALMREMAEDAGPGSIHVPRHGGVNGNPVLWGRDHFPRLAALNGDVGARILFDELAGQLRFFDTADPGVRTDIDTPEMLEALRSGEPR